MLTRVLLPLFLVALCFAAPSTLFAEPSDIEKAKALFAEYVRREHAFDPAVADLYSDDALIENTRVYPDGTKRKQTFPAPLYKQVLRAAMPLAKTKDDRSTYSSLEYATEGKRVRIKAQRYSLSKKYTSPMALLVGPDKSGAWLVFEEISESRP
jgi:hypothetical protein